MHCRDCPAAGLRDDDFGCVSYLNYPIPESAQQWLVRRIQPAGTLGGVLLLRAIADFDYDGSAMIPWRERGLWAGEKPAVAVMKKGMLKSTKVTSDQVMEAIFAAGGELEPTHCKMLLAFLGALRVDGDLPS